MDTHQAARADQLAFFGFEQAGNSGTTNLTPGAKTPSSLYGADSGVYNASSTVFGLHMNASTYSFPVGSGTSKAFSSNGWVSGDYYQFNTSSANATGLTLAYDQAGSATGPRDFSLEYSTDNGANFTLAAASYNGSAATTTYSLNTTSFTSANVSSATHVTVDLTSIAAVENATSLIFRILSQSNTSINGGTVASGGTDRVDNFDLEGSLAAAPEPTSLLLMGLATTPMMLRRRRTNHPIAAAR